MKIDKPVHAVTRSSGFSVVELLVAMVIGLVIIAGVAAVFVSNRVTAEVSNAASDLLDDAAFSIELISKDLRMSGAWGRQTHPSLIDARQGTGGQLANVSGDCAAGFYIDLERKIFATNDVNPFGATCLANSADYRDGTDILVVRYANPVNVPDASISANTVYLRSSPVRGELFLGGGTIPDVFQGGNYSLRTHIYYVANSTDSVGDGVPSLRRISLENGPTLTNEVIAPGVEDLQVQLGIDRCDPDCDDTVEYYLDADNSALDWTDPEQIDRILSVQLWLLVRSEMTQALSTSTTYVMGSRTVTTPEDGRKRVVVSNVTQLRNRAKL